MSEFYYTSVFASPPEVERWETNEEPVVIMLGWVGCRDRYLEKYSAMYGSLGCTTVRCITPWEKFFISPTKNLAPVAIEIEEMIEELDLGRNPIFVHLFSSGGCMVYNAWRALMIHHQQACEEAVAPSTETGLCRGESSEKSLLSSPAESLLQSRSTSSTNSKLYSNALNFRGLIIDSGPARPTSWVNALVLTQIHQTTTPFLRQYWVLALLHTAVVAAIFSLGDFIKLLKFKFEKFVLGWNVQMPSGYFQDVLLADPLRLPCAVLYSTADEICSSLSIEHFIEQQKLREVTVCAKKWADSPHCQHYRHHPDEYKQLVEEFISSNAEERPKNQPE